MPQKPLTIQASFALDAFLIDGQARRLSARTIHYYRQQLTWFFSHLAQDGCYTLDAITSYHIRAYLLHLQAARGWQPASVHAAARAIRAFFNFCVAEGWLAASPMTRVKMPKTPVKLLPAFRVDEVKALLTAAGRQRDKAILLCLLDTGCRAGEFLAWNVGDVNLATGTVRLHQTKNGQERTVYLGMKARREVLKLYATQSTGAAEPVWRNLHTGGRFRYEGLKTLLRELGEAADVRPCSAHRFRRTFALWSLRNGMDIFSLQQLMGHSDLSVLRRYLALVESDLQNAHAQFGAVDNML